MPDPLVPKSIAIAEPTDEMVERGARALEHWADAWGQPARREAAARAVLVAALSTSQSPEERNNA